MIKIKKFALALVGLASPAVLLAEDSAAQQAANQLATEMTDLVVPYVNAGKTAVITILTAGVVVVAGFFLWGLIKKAINRSK